MFLYYWRFIVSYVSVVEPVLFDAGLNVVCAQWCHNGSVLAVGGQQVGNKDGSYICFYSPFGNVCTYAALFSVLWQCLSKIIVSHEFFTERTVKVTIRKVTKVEKRRTKSCTYTCWLCKNISHHHTLYHYSTLLTLNTTGVGMTVRWRRDDHTSGVQWAMINYRMRLVDD